MAAVSSLTPAAAAFDAVAEAFDERFGGWRSVAAQRAAVRRQLLRAFPAGAAVLELGGGTGLDAAWLKAHGRHVLLTDASPAMVAVARRKGVEAAVCDASDLEAFAAARGDGAFDGAFSNFAALNCVPDLRAVGRGLARALRPGAPALLVLFGPFAPGEVAVQLLRGDAAAAFRRVRRGDVPARLRGWEFTVRYHRPAEVAAALRPWFRPVRRRGIGVFVPPSAAEPWISGHPHLLHVLEAADRLVEAPLALLGDHVLYHFVRTTTPVEEP